MSAQIDHSQSSYSSRRWKIVIVFFTAVVCLQIAACAKHADPRALRDKGGAKDKDAGAMAPPVMAKDTDFNTEQYDRIVENAFMLAAKEPLSTFSIDVDTASYSNVRRFLLDDNRLPPKDAVRIEEMINYFDYDYPQPEGDHPVAVASEVAACPWDDRLKLVRIGLQAKSILPSELPPRNFVFLLDTSGSMNTHNKLPLLKRSLELLVQELRPHDRVAIVAYAGSAGLVLDSTTGEHKREIKRSLARLQAGGSTNGGEGIRLAYWVAQNHFIPNGVNRVIIGTDGDFNVGVTGSELIRLIEKKRKTGIYLSVLGFGSGNLKDATMEKLAHHGNGHYAYIDTLAEAQKIFVEQGGAMYTLANDVKLQIEFNPSRVNAWRLIGYENRLMKHQDFNDDKKDAGDLGSGHAVTAFYVVAPPSVKLDIPNIDPLKYQKKSDLTKVAETNELLNVKIRYKSPGKDASTLLVHPVGDVDRAFAEATLDFRFAAAVAEFGMLLRESKYKASASYEHVLKTAVASLGADVGAHRREFVQMVQTARQLAAED